MVACAPRLLDYGMFWQVSATPTTPLPPRLHNLGNLRNLKYNLELAERGLKLVELEMLFH